MFYYDISYTLMPSLLTKDFHNTDRKYLDIFSETICINKTKKTILLWTKFFGSYYWESKIREELLSCDHLCEVTKDRSRLQDADALIFHHGDLKRDDLPSFRHLHQPWVMFTMEPTSLLSGNLNR